MMQHDGPAISESEFPVSVVMRREVIRRSFWEHPSWTLLAVLAAEPGQPRARREVHAEGECVDYVWTGYRINLFRDGSESYWYNLVGKQPSLFVICRPGHDVDLEPLRVTADHDEAGAMMEADEAVFSTPLPPVVATWLEAYVVNHYRPGPRKSRKRRDWVQESSR